MPVLTIVDMQNRFLDSLAEMDGGISLNDLITNVCTLVRTFRSKNLPIIALQYVTEHGFNLYDPVERAEYQEFAWTHHRILEELKGYDKFHIKWKSQDSGAIQVKNVVKKHKYDDRIIMCGVNACACVMDTWFNLKEKYNKEVYVISEATRNCGDDDPASEYITDVVPLKDVDTLLTSKK
jgi:nicotinamidase-related amidase